MTEVALISINNWFWRAFIFSSCNSLAAFSLQKFQLKIHKWIMWLSTVREKMQLLAKYQELSSIFHCNVTMVSLWFVMDDVHSLDCMRIKFRIYEFIFFAWFSMHFFLRIGFTVFWNRNGSLAWLCNTAYCSICIWHQFKRQLLLSQFFAFEYGIMSNGYSYDIFHQHLLIICMWNFMGLQIKFVVVRWMELFLFNSTSSEIVRNASVIRKLTINYNYE